MGAQVDDIEKLGSQQHEISCEADSVDKAEVHHDAATTPSSPQYSVLTVRQKRLVLFIATLVAMFSPLSSFIYYPALDNLAADLHTTVGKINLTITSYMVMSGIVPTMWGDLADQIGRKPVLMAMFAIYIGANIGLALQRSFPALLGLRMLQSVGGSATVGLGYGLVGDIITPAERGMYMSIATLGPNLTPALGPVLGGVLAQKAGWPYIFWFLVILASVAIGFIIIFYPETSRNVVGNGAVPAQGVHRWFMSLWPARFLPSPTEGPVVSLPRKPLRFPNPFLSVTLLLKPYNTPIMLIYGLFYTDYCVLQASLSTLFIEKYHYSTLAAGLIYIPFGAGCFLAAVLGGRLLNRDYRITATKHGWEKVDKVVGDDLLRFPIVEARLRSMPITIVLTVACMIPFGFLLEHKVHPAAPLALQFIMGGLVTFTFTIGNTILVDLHPKRPATAQASVNLVRCAMAGGGLAALQPLINAVGPGWCFVIFAGLTLSALGFWWIEMKWGLIWWRETQEAKVET